MLRSCRKRLDKCMLDVQFSSVNCEDGHLAAISLLYDIIVLTYSIVNNQWYVFNEFGIKGYICC